MGEWVTMIGPNGSGKSMLLRYVAATLRYQGSVALFGTPAHTLGRRTRARMLAMVAQSPVVPPGTTVTEYVLVGRTPHLPPFGRESAADHAVVVRALDRLHLLPWASWPLRTLSRGEKGLPRPGAGPGHPVAALDEPITALDVGHQQEVLDLVDDLRRERRLTVLSTMHDLTIAGQYADRLVLLAGGRVVAAGGPVDVLTSGLLAAHYDARVQVSTVDGRPDRPFRAGLPEPPHHNGHHLISYQP